MSNALILCLLQQTVPESVLLELDMKGLSIIEASQFSNQFCVYCSKPYQSHSCLSWTWRASASLRPQGYHRCKSQQHACHGYTCKLPHGTVVTRCIAPVGLNFLWLCLGALKWFTHKHMRLGCCAKAVESAAGPLALGRLFSDDDGSTLS